MKIFLKSVDEEEGGLTLELGLVDFDIGSIVAEDCGGNSVTYVPEQPESDDKGHIRFLEGRLRRVEAIVDSERKRADYNYERFCEARRTPSLDGMGVEMRGGEIVNITLSNGLEFVPKPTYAREPKVVIELRAELESLNTQLAVARALVADRLATIQRQDQLLRSRSGSTAGPR